MLLVLVMASGCKPGSQNWDPGGPAPDKLIPRELMVDLLVDIHVAEGDMIERNIRGAEQSELLGFYYPAILEKHQVSAGDFTSSYEWYVARPMLMKLIYEQVIDRLTAIQAELDREISEDRADPEVQEEDQTGS